MIVDDLMQSGKMVIPWRGHHRPKVSVVMPVYIRNKEGLLHKALDSVLSQSFTDFELLVMDDGSFDGTEETILTYARQDERIVYVRHERNAGLPAIRGNQGIALAQGEAIAFLFDDNIYTPDFLKFSTEALFASTVDAVYSLLFEMNGPNSGFYAGGMATSLETLLSIDPIPNGTIVCRRDFFERFGMYDPHLVLRRCCDWDLWLRSMYMGATFAFIPQVGAIEQSLISPHSLYNSVKRDYKLYAYVSDLSKAHERSQQLNPSSIASVDVLDPLVLQDYLRHDDEWSAFAELIYRPFLEQHKLDFSEFTAPMLGKTFSKKRILIVSNVMSALAIAWMTLLQRQDNYIVMNCAEWHIARHNPADIDVILLMDACHSQTLAQLLPFKHQGVRIIYSLEFNRKPPSQEQAARSFLLCQHHMIPHTQETYYPQPGMRFNQIQIRHIETIMSSADGVLGNPVIVNQMGFKGQIVDLNPVEFSMDEELVSLDNLDVNWLSYDMHLCPEIIDKPGHEHVVPPSVHLPHTRPSYESLAALCMARQHRCVCIERSSWDGLSKTEQYGLAVITTLRQVSLMIREDAKNFRRLNIRDHQMLQSRLVSIIKGLSEPVGV